MGGSLVLGLDWLSNPQVSGILDPYIKQHVLISAAVIPGGGGGGTRKKSREGVEQDK